MSLSPTSILTHTQEPSSSPRTSCTRTRQPPSPGLRPWPTTAATPWTMSRRSRTSCALPSRKATPTRDSALFVRNSLLPAFPRSVAFQPWRNSDVERNETREIVPALLPTAISVEHFVCVDIEDNGVSAVFESLCNDCLSVKFSAKFNFFYHIRPQFISIYCM